ncbi:hypothetical protein [Vibrio sp.]|uniref:hypothetical protein n=1 Tax=Vibrio sp. TaxID=678 RepID=UPI003AA7EE33
MSQSYAALLTPISAFDALVVTFALYIVNTIIAITAALTVGMIFQPGAGANLPVPFQKP